jgi:hypothetical protein
MKNVIIHFLVLLSAVTFLHSGHPPEIRTETLDKTTLDYIRGGFYESIENRTKTDYMLEYIESRFSVEYIHADPVLLAYYGVLTTLKAKHVFNPFSKILYLRSGLKLLHESTVEGACNLEVRFLRFSVLHNLPSFLGMGDTLKEDTEAVYELLIVDRKYTDLDPEMARDVIDFVIKSKRLNSAQQEAMILLAQRLENDEQLSFH